MLLSPTAQPIPCRKLEVRVPNGRALVQLWAEHSEQGRGAQTSPDLVVLRLLGARGRAELATQDPANRMPSIRSATWTLNPPRFGKSSGPLTAAGYLQGVLAAYDFLSARYPAASIWVYGKSIGATAALYLAAHRAPSGLIVKNAIDVPAVTRGRVAHWAPARLADWASASVPVEFHPAFWAPSAKSPALFVISDGDRLSPPPAQENIVRRYGGPSYVLRVQGAHDQAALTASDEPAYAAALGDLWASSKAAATLTANP
jgi:hypothetical protein